MKAVNFQQSESGTPDSISGSLRRDEGLDFVKFSVYLLI